MRRLVSCVVLVLILVILFQQLLLLRDPARFPPHDFVEYYAAGKLNLQGQNPYNPQLLLPIEIEAGRKLDEAVMMWNPPWTLTLVMPFSLIDANTAKVVWVLVDLVLLIFCIDQLWKIYAHPKSWRLLPYLFVLTYFPLLTLLISGQIGIWLLLGITLFLKWEKTERYFWAGAITVLMAIKPHLFYLFWVMVFFWGCRRRYSLLFGGIIAGLISSIIPILFNSEVWSQYRVELLQNPPVQWRSLTLGSVIREIEVLYFSHQDYKNHFSEQFIPLLFGSMWFLFYYWRYIPGFTLVQSWLSKRSSRFSTIPADIPLSVAPLAAPATTDQMQLGRHSHSTSFSWVNEIPKLLLVSFITSAYGAWLFDMVVLLPAVIHLLSLAVSYSDRLKENGRSNSSLKWLLGLWIVLNGLGLTLHLMNFSSFHFIWYAPFLTLYYFYGVRVLKSKDGPFSQ